MLRAIMLPLLTAQAAVAQLAPFTPRWLTNVAGDGLMRLHHGQPDSGDIGMTLACEPGSGVVTIGISVRRGYQAAWLKLASDGASGEFPARVEDLFDEGVYWDTHLAAKAPIGASVFTAFQETGAMAWGEPPSRHDAANAAELEAIRRFFAFCGAAPSA